MIYVHTLCRITNEPALKQGHNSGEAFLSFRAATDHGYGEKKTTTWLNCTLFGKRAESLSALLEKGQQVLIHGELFSREYQKKDGGAAQSIEIHINQIELVGKKSESKPTTKPTTKSEPNQESHTEEFDDDIPF